MPGGKSPATQFVVPDYPLPERQLVKPEDQSNNRYLHHQVKDPTHHSPATCHSKDLPRKNPFPKGQQRHLQLEWPREMPQVHRLQP